MSGYADSLSYAARTEHRRAVRVGPKLRMTWCGRRASVTDFGWVSDEFWPFIDDFVSPLPSAPPGTPPIDNKTPLWDASPYAKDLDRRLALNPKHAVCWGFQAATDRGYVTMWATLGQQDVVRWNWFQARVLRPIYRMAAAVATVFANSSDEDTGPSLT